jgi:hypothetical protein
VGTSGGAGSGAVASAGASAGASTGSNATASTGYGTPQDCAAAGGQCVLGGGGDLCAREGPANTCNCNPGCNPGGAICCIAFVGGGAQAGQVAPDGGQQSADAASEATEPLGAQCTTTAPLTAGSGPPTVKDIPFAMWCEHNVVSEQSYPNGALVFGVLPFASDCSSRYFFDASGQLQAAFNDCNGDTVCSVAADFVYPGDPDGGSPPVLNPCLDGGAAADFAGTWSCPTDDAGHTVSFTVTADASGLTETFSTPLMGAGGSLMCTEHFTVSGSTALLIPSLTSCTLPPGVNLEGVPSYGSQTVNGNALTYTGEDEGGPLQTIICTRQ